MNDTGRVKETTRARVRRVAEDLGYHPNVHAQTLAGGRSRTLGMIVSNLRNPFFQDIFHALEARAQQHGYDVVVANTDYRPQHLGTSARQMMGRRLAGLAVVVSEVEPEVFERLAAATIPVAFYDVGTPGENTTNIKTDYHRGTLRMAEYLYSLGHRRLGFIGHHVRLEPLHDRKASFLEVMKGHAAEVEHASQTDRDSPGGGYRATNRLLDSGFEPTALICANDFMALGALRALRDRGLDVPGQVSVAGCDNISLSKFACPSLTTLNIPRERIGHMIFDALSPEPPDPTVRGQEIVIDPDLIIRESTGRGSDLEGYGSIRA